MKVNGEFKSGRGGYRPGSGRKRTGKLVKNHSVTISGTKTEIQRIKDLAKEKNMSISRFIINTLDCDDWQNL